jgi:predicted methyltransferase
MAVWLQQAVLAGSAVAYTMVIAICTSHHASRSEAMPFRFNPKGTGGSAIGASLLVTLFAASVSAIGGVHVAQAAGVHANIEVAVADNARPGEDMQRDVNRKPGDTLAFADVRAGEQIGELSPGSGYFSRILSKAVGPKGHVFAIVTPRSATAPADQPDRNAPIKALAADPNYTNISVVERIGGKISIPTPVDLIFTAQNYHDFHNVPDLDIAAFNKSVFDALKPGGLYVIVDHSAQTGSGSRDTSTLHRIDVDTVRQEVAAAGFKLIASSDILKNAADDRTAKVFDPTVRGKTDQFILKFRKPKK